MGAIRGSLGAILTVAAIAVAGCGDDEASRETDPGGPLVVYQRSGGIAGVTERLEVGRDGSVAVTTGAVDPQHGDFRLSGEELEQLTAELEAADFGAVVTTGPDACADCFIESVATGGRPTTIVAEIDQPPDSVGTVLTHLRDLVARA